LFLDSNPLLPLCLSLLVRAFLLNLVIVIILFIRSLLENRGVTLLGLCRFHPLDQVCKEIAELLLSLLVVEHGLFVKTRRLVIPLLNIRFADCVIVQ